MDRLKRRFSRQKDTGRKTFGNVPEHLDTPTKAETLIGPTSNDQLVPPSASSASQTTPPSSTTSLFSSMQREHSSRPSAISLSSPDGESRRQGDELSHGLRSSGVNLRVDETMALLRQAIASGTMPMEEEIAGRESMAELSKMLFEATQDATRLTDAIQNYQAILRSLTVPSARRAKYLNKLAFLEMSAFGITQSLHTLDNSIAHSQQARDEALPTNDDLLPSIYHNLGYSVSHRAFMNNSDKDIEEAIDSGRQVLHLANPESQEYQISMLNLASRLQTRYKMHHRQADIEEAMSILDLQLQQYPPGSHQHASALLVKSRMFYEQYDQTKDIKDIEEAMKYAKQGLATVPEGHERVGETLLLLVSIHRKRYEHTGQLSDLEATANYAKQRMQTVPETYQIWPDLVASYLHACAEYVLDVNSPEIVLKTIIEIRPLRNRIAKTHAKRHSCNLSFVAMLSKKYIMTRELADLSTFVQCVLDSSYEYNDKLDLSQQRAATQGIWDFLDCVRKIDKAPPNSPVRIQAHERLYHFQLSQHQIKQFMIVATRQHADEVKVYARSLESEQKLAKAQVDDGIATIQREDADKAAEARAHAERMRSMERDDYIDPLLGHRNLALNPSNGRIMLSMEGLVKSLLGWDEDGEEPASWEEFKAREARLERESFEKAQREGKHPNPSLCRMCRATKPLAPLEGGGWTWNKKMWIPFGTHGQLMTRKHCSICRLILSLITINGDTLHPRLAQIDREVQGTQFHIQRLPEGELMLGVEYGMITVGALRMLTPGNVTTALRQSPPPPVVRSALATNPLSETQVMTLTDGEQRVDFSELRRWIYNCHANHGELCNGLERRARYAQDIPLYLIDVRSNCLVLASSAKRYYTLSYVWGQVKIDKTVKANVQARMESGGLVLSDLPKTIRDAIALVLALGGQYLWTDAVCIVQDDEVRKARDLPRMDIVYKKGFANIVAMSGNDADAGLPGVSPNSRPSQAVERFQITSGSKDLALQKENGAMTDLLHLVATPIPLSFAQEGSIWNTRGWILQEQVLARRNIYFSQGHVYFRCNELERSEATLEGKFGSFWGDREAEEDHYEKGADKLQINNPLTELRQIADVSKEERLRLVFQAYANLVEIYTTRNLTQEADILNAFSGMLSAFTEYFESKTFCGLPIAALDLALLWTPAQSLRVRTIPKPASSPSSPSPLPNQGQLSEVSEMTFPTWSWAGWIGEINYRLLRFEKEPPPDSLIGEFYIVQGGKILRLLGYQRAPAGDECKALGNDLAVHFTPSQVTSCASQPVSVLHFIAPLIIATEFTVERNREPDYLSSTSHIHTQSNQAVVRLHDRNGKHCGILFEHVDYYALLKHVSGQTKSNLEDLQALTDKVIFAISQTKDVYGDRKELYRVEGGIKLFDEYEYPAQGPGSALVNVLVVRLGVEDMFERIAVGQIHVKAWEAAGPQRSWVKLA